MRNLFRYAFVFTILLLGLIFLSLQGLIFCIYYCLLKGTSLILRKWPNEILTTTLSLICFIPKVLVNTFSATSNYLFILSKQVASRTNW